MSNQNVFVNRILNMKKIKYIGLDMDHTLIRYHTKNFETLVFRLVIDTLIAKKNYPEIIKTVKFNFTDAIRGLIIDSKNGNILKLSRFGAIRQSYHGTQPINYLEQKKIYRSTYVDLKDANYMAIDTSFSIAFCVLYSQLVDLKDKQPALLPSYAEMAVEVLATVDQVHADGSLKQYIVDDLQNYVVKDKKLVEGLRRFIAYGTKFFLLTNSDYAYTKVLLDYALTPFLPAGENWRDVFQFIITLADKPRFFYDNSRFLTIDFASGAMTNLRGKIVPGIYQGGSAKQFTEDLQLNGDQILYIGDHIYGDILRLKKDCNWRTALVVEELSAEIEAQRKALPTEKKITDAMEIKKELEQNYVDLCSKNIEGSTPVYDEKIADCQKQIQTLDSQISDLLTEEQGFYNFKWGRIFRTGAEESYFAYQVDRFACIYMEKLTDLLEHSPITYFRARRRLLPHDVDF